MLSSVFIRHMTIITKMQWIFGTCWYSGESKILNLLLHGYCVFCFLFVGIFFRLFIYDQVYYSQFSNDIIPAYINSFDYIISGVVALVLKGKFQKKISSFINLTGSILNVKHLTVSKTLYIFLFFLIVYRVSVYIIYIYVLTKNSHNNIIVYFDLFLFFTANMKYISSILVFDIIYHRMKLVRWNLEKKKTLVNVISENETRSNRTQNIEKSLVVYDCLITFVKDFDHELHIWIISSLLIYFLKCVVYLHNAILCILQKQFLIEKVFIPIHIFAYSCVLVALPIILFELARNEVENIKEFLSKSALMENDKELVAELLHALEYIKLRPFELRIYRALPFDMSLLLNFMSLTVTYVIIVAQFKS